MRYRNDILRVAARQAGGELGVGAFARRQARRRLAAGAGGLGLLALAVVVYLQLSPRGGPPPGAEYPAVLRCVDCGYQMHGQLRPEQPLPLDCPQCAGRSMYELWRCRECGQEFVPAPRQRPVRCPQCGEQQVGSAARP